MPSIVAWALAHCNVCIDPQKSKFTEKPATVLVDIERHSWLERQETQFGHTMAIFGNFLLNITVLLD